MKDINDEMINKIMEDCPKTTTRLKRNQFLSREKIEKLKEEKFIKLVNYAYNNVPLYKKKYDEAGIKIEEIKTLKDIEKLPILEKEELIEGFPNDTVSKEYNVDDLTIGITGGTTGKTLNIAYSDETMLMRVFTSYRMFDLIADGYNRDDVHTYVYTSKFPLGDSLPDGSFPMHFICTLDSIEKSKEILLKTKPNLLTMYPSRLEDILRELSEEEVKEISKNLKAICVKSEMSTQKQRDEWSRIFNVPVLDEYGSEELCGTVAAQCQHKGYHIWEDLNIIEAVDENGINVPDGELGELLGTNLYNYAMPLIRYRQGDLVSILPKEVKCECGREFQMIKELKGRKNSTFKLKSGKVLSSGYLLDVGYVQLIKYRNTLKSWVLIQEKIDKVVFECIPGEGLTEEIKANIKKDVEKLLFNEAEVEVRLVKDLPVSARGKRKQIISEI